MQTGNMPPKTEPIMKHWDTGLKKPPNKLKKKKKTSNLSKMQNYYL